MRVLGVDPGTYGALALLDTGQDTLTVEDMPTISVKRPSKQHNSSVISESHLADLVQRMSPDVAWIERVHAMPKQGVASSFNFGVTFGLIRGVLAASKVPFYMVTATEWKRAFRLGANKQEARLLASRMFPREAQTFARVRDDGRAEATLLAVFGAKYPL